MYTIFRFEPLQENHLDTLTMWLNKHHVKEWWNDNLSDIEIKSKYRERIRSSTILPFIAYINDKPVGFIQYYYANKIGNNLRSNELDGTIGIDQFIGEEDYIGRGYGMQMMEQFLCKLFSDDTIIKVITAISKNNHRAIRCYEKLGFYLSHEEQTPDGIILIMNRYRNTNVTAKTPPSCKLIFNYI